MTADEPIAKRNFSLADQEAFARISGDSNPMHLDAVAARRTMAGAPVVHGVHGALWALEKLCEAGVPISALTSIKVQFPKFVHLDCEVALRIARRKDDTLKVAKKLTITVGESIMIKSGDASISMQKNGNIVIKGKDITIEGSGAINVKASKDVVVKGSKIAQN